MPDTVFGLPLHALVMHAGVTLVPLAALCLMAIALVPRWRARYGIAVVLITTAAMAVVPVVTQSGEQLRTLMGYDPETFEHGLIAEGTFWWTLPMWVTAGALVVLDRRRRSAPEAGPADPKTSHPPLARSAGRGAVMLLVAVLAVVASGAATVQIIRAGHSGAESVWQGRVPAQQ